jgi:hypothetical protein
VAVLWHQPAGPGLQPRGEHHRVDGFRVRP